MSHLGRVLVVEDDAGVREVEATFLSGLGYVVDVAGNGHDGFRRYLIQRPDVVLLDLRLPDADGAELFHALRWRDPAVPIVVVSAYDEPHLAEELLAAGAFDYLPKPCDLDSLERAVRAAAAARTGSPDE